MPRVETMYRREGGGEAPRSVRISRKGSFDLRSLESELEKVQVACLGAYAKFQNLKQSVEKAGENIKARYRGESSGVLVEELVELQEEVVSQKAKLAQLRRKHAHHTTRHVRGSVRTKPGRHLNNRTNSAAQHQRKSDAHRNMALGGHYFSQIEESRKERVHHFAELGKISREKLGSLVGFIDLELSKLSQHIIGDPIQTSHGHQPHMTRHELLTQSARVSIANLTNAEANSTDAAQHHHTQQELEERQVVKTRKLSAMANFPGCKRDRIRVADLQPILRSKAAITGKNKKKATSTSPERILTKFAGMEKVERKMAQQHDVSQTPDDVSQAPGDVSNAPDDVSNAPGDVSLTVDDVNNVTDQTPLDVNEAANDVSFERDDVSQATDDVSYTLDDVSVGTDDLSQAPDDLGVDDLDSKKEEKYFAVNEEEHSTEPPESVEKTIESKMADAAALGNKKEWEENKSTETDITQPKQFETETKYQNSKKGVKKSDVHAYTGDTDEQLVISKTAGEEGVPGQDSKSRRSNLSKIMRPHTGRKKQRIKKDEYTENDEVDGEDGDSETTAKLQKFVKPNDLVAVKRRGSYGSTYSSTG